MVVKTLIRNGEYHDSVSLMLIAKELRQMVGVGDAAVIMATEANKDFLRNAGMENDEVKFASPNDLVICIKGEADDINKALTEAERLLSNKQAAQAIGGGISYHPKTLRAVAKSNPNSNMAVISVAGKYAFDEAWEALHLGLHVLLFSDNVSIEHEVLLKEYAHDYGLLLMGPGAGTAIINSVALGFANVVPQGPVGIVSAAGTGLQEVSTILAKHGVGISQGIGIGGRDLKMEVGGIMMLDGIEALQGDDATKVIVLISKPPDPVVASKIMKQLIKNVKPSVVCFLGNTWSIDDRSPSVFPVSTLKEAAIKAVQLLRGEDVELTNQLTNNIEFIDRFNRTIKRLKPDQRYLRALYSGGTLAYEAQVIWKEILVDKVYSNVPLCIDAKLPDSYKSIGHTIIDLGEEEFTVGRPHPMIDNDLRIRRLIQEVNDPEVALILFDVVIGYGAHPDPASELAKAVNEARKIAQENRREIVFIASVTGTEADPQKLSWQVKSLNEAGVFVCESNADAARFAVKAINRN